MAGDEKKTYPLIQNKSANGWTRFLLSIFLVLFVPILVYVWAETQNNIKEIRADMKAEIKEINSDLDEVKKCANITTNEITKLNERQSMILKSIEEIKNRLRRRSDPETIK